MMEEFARLLRLRFNDKNRRIIERLTEEKQSFNSRGLLISSMTVQAMHRVLESEFTDSAHTVMETAIDVINKNELLLSEKSLRASCFEALAARKGEIESIFLSEVTQLEQGLQNKTMLAPFMSLAASENLQQEEMLIRLSVAYKAHLRNRGVNLAGVINRRFLNHPLIASAKIVGVVIVFISAVIAAYAGCAACSARNSHRA